MVSVPYDQTFAAEQLRVWVDPTDPQARVTVAVERWRGGALEAEGSVTGDGVLVQVRGDALQLTTLPLGPVQLHVF